LQRKLYDKAKTEPGFRFYILYDKVWRADILHHAYRLAHANDGAPGVDGVTFEQIETVGAENWLSRLGEELRTQTYRCQPPAPRLRRGKLSQGQALRRVMIPKPGGGERPLGIPTIRDRVVQTAAKLVLEPIPRVWLRRPWACFEADLDPAAFGYRPKRGGGQAIQKVLALRSLPLRKLAPAEAGGGGQGYTDVVDADLSKYFDTIPHPELMGSIARRIVDANMLRLIKQWLKAPVETASKDGGTRMTGGKANKMGVPPAPRPPPPQGQAFAGTSFAGAGSRRRHQSVGREPLHEPLPEILAPERQGGGLGRAYHQLRGRLRYP
jgi:RNA-directed DNA polymerase